MCNLLNMEIPDFLRMTQIHTIPKLVLTKRRQILQRIADANGPPCSIDELCMHQEHLPAILACLLLQPSRDPEAMVMSLLSEASPIFQRGSITEVAKIAPANTACELLKVAGEDEHQSVQVGPHSLLTLKSRADSGRPTKRFVILPVSPSVSPALRRVKRVMLLKTSLSHVYWLLWPNCQTPLAKLLAHSFFPSGEDVSVPSERWSNLQKVASRMGCHRYVWPICFPRYIN
jgi:hypothetical protein